MSETKTSGWAELCIACGHTEHDGEQCTWGDDKGNDCTCWSAAKAPTRAETGPMQFGDDWPGVFIRGDNAGAYAMLLRDALKSVPEDKRDMEWIQTAGLVADLGGCVVGPGRKVDPQMMRSFAEARATAPLTDALDAEGPIRLRIRLTRDNAKPPTYATDGASGMDGYMAAWTTTRRALAHTTECFLRSGERILCHLGIAAEIPPDYELQVRPRSGLALKHGVVAMLGTIDSDYRGEIGATLVNLGDEPYTLAIGDRVCQLVLAPVARARVEVVDALSESARGERGFGSSGR